MEFKVLCINELEKIKNKVILINDDEDIMSYNFENNFYCFKLKKQIDTSEKGVETNEKDIVNLSRFLNDNEASRMVNIAYVFINSVSGKTYTHNYSNKSTKKLLEKYFLLKDAYNNVDINKLEKLVKIKVKLSATNQINFLHDNTPIQNTTLSKELEFQDNDIKSYVIEYNLVKEGAKIKANKLQEIRDRYKNISFSGLDNKNNIIKIDDAIQLCVDIDINCKDAEELDQLDYKSTIQKLLAKELETLYGY